MCNAPPIPCTEVALLPNQSWLSPVKTLHIYPWMKHMQPIQMLTSHYVEVGFGMSW